jgi:hypothetical protein
LSLDLVSGFTLAAYAIPVALAYSALAGLPSQVGLYCYMLGAIATSPSLPNNRRLQYHPLKKRSPLSNLINRDRL